MDIVAYPLSAMGALFIPFTFLALLPATVFLWLVYLGYEYVVKSGYGCPDGCDIRIDLLVIYPVLILTSIIAAIRAIVCLISKTVGK